jgi:hypothetical protein
MVQCLDDKEVDVEDKETCVEASVPNVEMALIVR